MRLASDRVDMDAFRRYVADAGGVEAAVHPDAGEVMRFRIGGAMGTVTQDKKGFLIFGSIARPIYEGMRAGKPATVFSKRRP